MHMHQLASIWQWLAPGKRQFAWDESSMSFVFRHLLSTSQFCFIRH